MAEPSKPRKAARSRQGAARSVEASAAPDSTESPGGALGLVETRGLAAGTEAADAMVKSANVVLLSRQQVGGGIITILVRGDVGSVQAAVDAGAAAAAQVGQVLSAKVIPRPASETETILSRPPVR